MDVQNILSTIDLAELRNHIIQTSIVAWKNYITESSLDRWLKNFDGAALGNAVVEQTIAAWLLLNFTYYTDTENSVRLFIASSYIENSKKNITRDQVKTSRLKFKGF